MSNETASYRLCETILSFECDTVACCEAYKNQVILLFIVLGLIGLAGLVFIIWIVSIYKPLRA